MRGQSQHSFQPDISKLTHARTILASVDLRACRSLFVFLPKSSGGEYSYSYSVSVYFLVAYLNL